MAGAFSAKLNVLSILLILLSDVLHTVEVFVGESPLLTRNLLKSKPYACSRSRSPMLSEDFCCLSVPLCSGWKYGYNGLLRPSPISGICNDCVICLEPANSADFESSGSKSSLLPVESNLIKSGTSGESCEQQRQSKVK